jgi:hypothetical protein
VAVSDLAIDGGDLLEAGIRAGPAVGAMLQRLLGAVLVDPQLNRRETLLGMARELADETAGGEIR